MTRRKLPRARGDTSLRYRDSNLSAGKLLGILVAVCVGAVIVVKLVTE